MSFTTRAEGTETVVQCNACGWEKSLRNKDLCAPDCPPDCAAREPQARVEARRNHECPKGGGA